MTNHVSIGMRIRAWRQRMFNMFDEQFPPLVCGWPNPERPPATVGPVAWEGPRVTIGSGPTIALGYNAPTPHP